MLGCDEASRRLCVGGSKHLGHATVSITLDANAHALPAMQEEEAALIAGLVFAEQ